MDCQGSDDSLEAARGKVYLVGAGPGNPDLLTVRGLDLLRSAEVVAYDELVSPAILDLAPATAELLAVGHRHGSPPPAKCLHGEVLRRAKAGKRVVRLKGGDPFIFGRAGEEAEELAEEGIPFEIVPGVSAAFGAAAGACIPLTDRRYASNVIFATGHDAGGGNNSLCDWDHLAAGQGTIVLYMVSRTLRANLARLISCGRAPDTPAAYIVSATLPRQQIIMGTLADLADKIAVIEPSLPAGTPALLPALLIVGEVVRVREYLADIESGVVAA